MRRPRTATVILPAYATSDPVPDVVRDLAVAAYALESRDIALSVLVVAGHPQAAGAAAVRQARDLGLALELLPDPPADEGAAYLAAFRHVVLEARSDLVVTLDVNGRHDPAEIPRLVDELTARDLDVVIGSRWARGSGTPGLTSKRWLLGRLANLAFRVLTGTRGVADATTSFRVARIETIRAFEPDGGKSPLNNQAVQTAFVAMARAAGFKIGEAPIIYGPARRPGGELHGRDIAAFATHLRRLRNRVEHTRQLRLAPSGRVFDDRHFGAADDLERLGTAQHFFDWVLDGFDPYLRGRLLEVGAGVGTITRKLSERYPTASIVALEPAANLYSDLASAAAFTNGVQACQQTLRQHADEVDEPFDAVLYLNVLEHIADDAGELRLAAGVLRPGGTLLVFGPALEWLYSELDHKAGHYRRYTVAQARRLAVDAGLEVVSARYLDLLGVLPYLVVYRLLRRTEITGSTMWGYDRLVVPLSRAVQRALGDEPPLGKNIVLVARKP